MDVIKVSMIYGAIFFYIVAVFILLPFLLNPILLKFKLRDNYEPAWRQLHHNLYHKKSWSILI